MNEGNSVEVQCLKVIKVVEFQWKTLVEEQSLGKKDRF